MREIALDTETTGISHANGHRITEIGCVEIIDKKITGNSFHVYVNPERELSIEAQDISGLTYSFLKNHRKFAEIANDFLMFIRDSRLIIHNAAFDIGFLNMELKLAVKPFINNARVIDTLKMAQQKFPGSPATLDALCKRFSVDSSKRIKHGALIDAELLAEVYINMSVELKQTNIFSLQGSSSSDNIKKNNYELSKLKKVEVSQEEKQNHQEFLKKIKNPIWEKYL